MAVTHYSREQFLALFAELRDELLADMAAVGMPTDFIAGVKELLDYNVPGGKLNRGLTVVHALEAIRGGALSTEEARRAGVLGWAIEWLQAFFLIADDIMDASPTRRGAPCWYRLAHIGMISINDAFLLQSQMFRLLKRYFGADAALYAQLLELFIDTTWRTELGQGLDLSTQPLPGTGVFDLERFTVARYRMIVKHKTAYYSFHLPVCCGLLLAGLTEEAASPRVANILLKMGEYFQVQCVNARVLFLALHCCSSPSLNAPPAPSHTHASIETTTSTRLQTRLF